MSPETAAILAGVVGFIVAWPILISLAFAAIIMVLLVTEHEFFSSVLLVLLTVAGILLMYNQGVAIGIGQLAMYIGIYIAGGFIFTMPKWYLWAQKMGRKFQAYKDAAAASEPGRKADYIERFVNERLSFTERRLQETGGSVEAETVKAKISILKVEAATSWGAYDKKEFITDWNVNSSKGVMKIKALDDGTYDVFYHKETLVGYLISWVLNWPFYLVLLLIEDFVIEVANWFADRVGKIFRGIATKAFNQPA